MVGGVQGEVDEQNFHQSDSDVSVQGMNVVEAEGSVLSTYVDCAEEDDM